MRRVLGIALIASAPLCAQATVQCRTPIGIPCATIRLNWSQWQNFRRGITDINHFTWTETIAIRRDGSMAVLTTNYVNRSLFRGTSQGLSAARLYDAAADRVITVDHSRQTISNREPLIWHDRPYRLSEDGDTTCSTGIRHRGTHYRPAGMAVVAGIPVVKWTAANSDYGEDAVYLAPSLDCRIVKIDSSRYAARWFPKFIQTMEAESITVGEPRPELFAVPATYKHVEDPTREQMLWFVEQQRRNQPMKRP